MKTRMQTAPPLAEEPFFSSLNESLLSRVSNYVYHREYEPRQIIYFPDDRADGVYWVRTGRVKVTRMGGEGRDLTFRHLFPGDMLGEESLVSDGPRDSYAEAMSTSLLCIMRSDDFRRLVREEPEVSGLVARRLAERVMELESVLAETVFKTVRSRVASGLYRLYQKVPESENGMLWVTHQEIASLVGSTRETTTTVLHNLREEGILAIYNRRVQVLDPVALEHLARSA